MFYYCLQSRLRVYILIQIPADLSWVTWQRVFSLLGMTECDLLAVIGVLKMLLNCEE